MGHPSFSLPLHVGHQQNTSLFLLSLRKRKCFTGELGWEPAACNISPSSVYWCSLFLVLVLNSWVMPPTSLLTWTGKSTHVQRAGLSLKAPMDNIFSHHTTLIHSRESCGKSRFDFFQGGWGGGRVSYFSIHVISMTKDQVFKPANKIPIFSFSGKLKSSIDWLLRPQLMLNSILFASILLTASWTLHAIFAYVHTQLCITFWGKGHGVMN